MVALADRFIPLTIEQTRSGHTEVYSIQLVSLGSDLTALFHPLPDGWTRDTRRLSFVTGHGKPIAMSMATQLELIDGTKRNLILLKGSVERLRSIGLRVREDPKLLAVLDPNTLQSPVTDALALLEGLTVASSHRLLRLLLTTGCSLLCRGDLKGLDQLLPHLLQNLTASKLTLVSLRAFGSKGCIGTWRCAYPDQVSRIDELILVHDGQASRVGGPELIAQNDPRRLDCFLPFVPPAGAKLIGFGAEPYILDGAKPGEKQKHIRGWFRRCTPKVQTQLRNMLVKSAQVDPVAAAQLAEIDCPQEQQPNATILLAEATRGGILYACKLKDPMAFAKSAMLRTGSQTIEVSLTKPIWHTLHGALHVGFVPLGTALPEQPDKVAVDLVTQSNRVLRCPPVETSRQRAPIPEFFQGIDQKALIQPLAAALRSLISERPQLKAQCYDIGPQPKKKALTICVSPGVDRDYLRAVLTSALMASPPKTARILVNLRSQTELSALNEFLPEIHAITGFPIRVSVMPDYAWDAEVIRAALSLCRNSSVIWLDPGVLPLEGDWCGLLYRRSRGRSVKPRRLQIDATPIGGHTPAGSGSAQTQYCQVLNPAGVESVLRQPLTTVSAKGVWETIPGTLASRTKKVPRDFTYWEITSNKLLSFPLLAKIEELLIASKNSQTLGGAG